MYPRCDNADEARQVVRWAKFYPQGERGVDSGGPDNPYCFLPLAEYLKKANEETFLVIQIEDPKPSNTPTPWLRWTAWISSFSALAIYILSGIAGQWDPKSRTR